ncbi:MAG: hypothetical protein B7Z66_14790 [Chromatiales bacterium 21-64-14]|nr:MAG: hypothetical protein B7Z66_14790 [Chromatiales bacterium 21-64-14]HQU17299.1 hypothetical protein [Gammaproteobacteria bacterium]
MSTSTRCVSALVALSLGACATIPNGPSVMVLPGSGKNFNEFQADNAICRQFAQMQVGESPNRVAGQSTLRSAGLAALLGGALGAALSRHDPGRGAAVGAATGAVVGTAAGAGAGNDSAYELQRRYDYAYMQCMYAKGNEVPVDARLQQQPSDRAYPPPPPPPGPYYDAPPPPGSAPPAVPPPGTPPPD